MVCLASRSALLGGLGLLVLTLFVWQTDAQDGAMTEASVEGRIVAKLLADGRIEFGFQPEGQERILPRSRFFPATSVGRWLLSSEVEHDGDNLGRVTAMRLADGRVEFGFVPSGGERILPRVRYFPVNARVDRWLRSSIINVTNPGVTESEPPQTDTGDGPTGRCVASNDRAVLATFYRSLDGDDWRRDSGWLSNDDMDDWYGITTDADGCVTLIQLSDNDLKGAIPSAVGSLSRLRELDLSWNNDISGAIPATLGNLTSLEVLDLNDQTGQHDRSRGLTGEIPQELGRLTRLRILDLGWHRLDGEIPAELGNLSELRELSLHGNDLSGPIPSEFGGLSKLRSLWLNHNDLDGAIPRELGDLTRLTLLTLTSNELSGSIPPELGNLTSLETLRLNLNNLSGPIPAELAELSRLEELDLGDNDFSGAIPSVLGLLTRLEDLDLAGNRLSGAIPSALDGLSRLRELYLQNNDLSGQIPSGLGELSRLEIVFLAGNEFTGCVPAQFKDLRRSDISRLGLDFCGTTGSVSQPSNPG